MQARLNIILFIFYAGQTGIGFCKLTLGKNAIFLELNGLAYRGLFLGSHPIHYLSLMHVMMPMMMTNDNNILIS